MNVMLETLYVISDLHLGGDQQYAICTPEGQRLLVNFLEFVKAQAESKKAVHLIVNGDSVDFLAERPFQAFTSDDGKAAKKLASVFGSTDAVWKAFRALVAAGGRITFTIGNHDIELTLPGPRSLLERMLGSGQVELLLDGESLHVGDVLIKHGNQYDRWNRVDHDTLTRLRDCFIRGEEPCGFDPPAGSRLVNEIMNPIKETFSFINLLKPENQAAIPILAILRPSVLGYIDEFVPLLVAAQLTGVDTSAVAAPIGGLAGSHLHPDDAEEFRLAREVAYEGDTEQVGWARDWLTRWSQARDRAQKRKELERLRKVLDRWLHKHLLTFDTTLEDPDYLSPASRAASEHGFKTIVYGHTHLAKRIPIPGTSSVYLNTGTWADLMCVPDSILLGDLNDKTEDQLSVFAQDLKDNNLKRWVHRLPTFARIEMKEGCVQSSRLLIWKGDGAMDDLPSGRVSRLLVDPADPDGGSN